MKVLNILFLFALLIVVAMSQPSVSGTGMSNSGSGGISNSGSGVSNSGSGMMNSGSGDGGGLSGSATELNTFFAVLVGFAFAAFGIVFN